MSIKSFIRNFIWKTNEPWVDVRYAADGLAVVDYNRAFIEDLRRKSAPLSDGKPDEELLKFFKNPDYFAEQKRIEDERELVPKIEIAYEDGKPVVKSYNKAFVEEQRKLLGAVCDGRSDEDVVKLFIDRDALDREEPRLDILHTGIEEDGRIKMKLDWNRSFINHLRKHGITGETEEQAVQAYLEMITAKEIQDVPLNELYSADQINEAFKELDKELQQEYKDAEKKVEKKPRRRRTFK